MDLGLAGFHVEMKNLGAWPPILLLVVAVAGSMVDVGAEGDQLATPGAAVSGAEEEVGGAGMASGSEEEIGSDGGRGTSGDAIDEPGGGDGTGL